MTMQDTPMEWMPEQCGRERSLLPKDPVVAMAYVPFQQFDSPTYSPLQGLESGTMFPVLNKPFYGKKCGEGLD